MFIVWGTKRKKKKLGVVADFCPICREVRKFELFRIGLALHVYYISFGQGKLAGWEMQCTECGSVFVSSPERYQQIETHDSPLQDVATLMHTTFPRLPEALGDRLQLETKVRRGPTTLLTPDERMRLIREPFMLVNPELEARYKRGTEMDRPAGIGCLGTLLLVAIAVGLAIYYGAPKEDDWFAIAGIVAAVGGIYTFVQLGRAPGRYLRSRTADKLSRALGPLRPTEEELRETLARCKAGGMKIGQKLKLKVLWEELERREREGRA